MGQRRFGGMFLVAALGANFASAAPSLVYDVSGRVTLPKHGSYRTHVTAVLTEVRPGLMRLDLDKPALLDEHGATHSMPAHLTLDRHPFFFRRAETGAISDVIHHPDEHVETIGAKK